MREAFVYMFKDNCFWKKALTYFFIGFIANVFIAYSQINSCTGMCPLESLPKVSTVTPLTSFVLKLIGIFINMILAGYMINTISAILKQENNIILPFFNYGNCFIKGFKLNVSIFFTTIFFTIIAVLISLLGLHWGYIFFAILTLLYIIFGTAFIWSYVEAGKFLTFLNFRRAFQLIKTSPKRYFLNVLMIYVLISLGAFIAFVLEIILAKFAVAIVVSLILSTILTSLVATYLNFVNMYLVAKSIESKVVV